jgi:deoxyinosine 3'endonuclease (endonuclease V)
MFAAFDVHYLKDGSASVAVVMFSDYRNPEPSGSFTRILLGAADYIPGEFYKRELPCILAILNQMSKFPDEIVVDGYVMLGNRPGLGRHLYEYLNEEIPVIGVAKSKFAGAKAVEIYRGMSKNPLYITTVGMDLEKASAKIGSMHGSYRIPTLLKCVDQLARKAAQNRFSDLD